MIYIILIILFIIIFIGGLLGFLYLSKDEKNLKEVTTVQLSRLGKIYTKEEYENKMFDMYVNIISGIQNNDYNLLKDIVSDEEYNKILLEIKQNQEQNVKKMVDHINKGFSKLIEFKIVNDLEVSKLWVQYSDTEYVLGNREIENEDGSKEIKEIVISGDKDKILYHEYILTFVKDRTSNEDIMCPSCGYKSNMLLRSYCPNCDTLIVPKKMHWVYVGKVSTNINNTK